MARSAGTQEGMWPWGGHRGCEAGPTHLFTRLEDAVDEALSFLAELLVRTRLLEAAGHAERGAHERSEAASEH